MLCDIKSLTDNVLLWEELLKRLSAIGIFDVDQLSLITQEEFFDLSAKHRRLVKMILKEYDLELLTD